MNQRPKPGGRANLHLAHSWGGGTARFIEDFARADQHSSNLVLESFGTSNCFGVGLRLKQAASGEVLDRWVLNDPVTEVRDRHPEHRRILEAICGKYQVEHIYLSSLIGHSLDVLRLGIPITRIYHDYFPECPAVHLYRGKVCTSCTRKDLELCVSGNDLLRPMASARYHLALREAILDAMAAADIRHVSPSRSLIENMCRIERRFEQATFSVIEHGISYRKRNCFGGADDDRRLRVGFLGHLGSHKGLDLLSDQFGRLRAIADLHFLGAGDPARKFAERWGCRFIHYYQREALPRILAEHQLDLLLFLSLVPETFSYTLSEAWCFCVPPAAVAIGALAERIEHKQDGVLLGSDEGEVVDFLLDIDRERSKLREIATRLADKPVRSAGEAVADYYRLRGSPVVATQLR